MGNDRNTGYDSLQQVLELSPINQVYDHVPVINKDSFEYFIYLHIPSEIARSSVLFDVKDITSSPDTSVDYEKFFIRDCMKPWIRVESRILDLTSGQHTYKLQFINKHTDDTFSLYFSYIVQDDNVDKPYIYMNRE